MRTREERWQNPPFSAIYFWTPVYSNVCP